MLTSRGTSPAGSYAGLRRQHDDQAAVIATNRQSPRVLPLTWDAQPSSSPNRRATFEEPRYDAQLPRPTTPELDYWYDRFLRSLSCSPDREPPSPAGVNGARNPTLLSGSHVSQSVASTTSGQQQQLPMIAVATTPGPTDVVFNSASAADAPHAVLVCLMDYINEGRIHLIMGPSDDVYLVNTHPNSERPIFDAIRIFREDDDDAVFRHAQQCPYF